MNTSLASDLERLKKMPYHRLEWSGEVIRKIHRLPKKSRAHPDFQKLLTLHRWLFVPTTLWPINIDGLCHHLLDGIQIGKRLDKKTETLLSLLGNPPEDSVQAVVTQHEVQVQQGHYDSLLQAHHKYNFKEQALLANPDFKADWQHIRKLFEIKKFQDRKGIIRRRMVEERNFRSNFEFQWKNETGRFGEIFDAFCHRWNLYGMKHDAPLLLQMTVNLTPHGTMIFIPAYWSFDPKRDFKWQTISALHRARGVPRQGPKLDMGKISRIEEARKAKILWDEATKAGLKGDGRIRQVMGQMNWDPRTDESKLKRLLKMTTA